jgi:peptide/nickel transport system substrate-binding protein
MRRLSVALLLTSICGTALAADPCDTLVIPPAVGVGSPSDITSLNQLISESLANLEASSYLYANLLWIDQAGQIDFSRSIARQIDVFDNGQRYVVTMRPWPWSDGAPVTADDVLYTWKLIQKLGTNYVQYGQGGVPQLIASFKVLSPEQFQITLTRPVNPIWFELDGLEDLVPFPRHAWGEISADQLWQKQNDPQFFKVADGPYQLEEFKLGRSISFVPNQKYPLEHSPFHRMVIKFLQNGGTELQGVQSGEVDLADLPPEAFDASKSIKNVHVVVEPGSFSYWSMGLNFKNAAAPFFKDVRVRQAIEDAIDQKSMITRLWRGYGEEAYGPVPLDPPGFLSPAARAGRFSVGYDPQKSASLLDQAGYTLGNDGIRVKNGVRLEFTVLIPSGTINELMVAQFMQPELRKLGIVMQIKLEDFNQMLATLYNGIAPWQAYIIINSLPAFPSGEGTFTTGGVDNFGKYSDPKMDDLVSASINQPGLDGLFKFEDYASEQQPVIFLPQLNYVVLERNGISGAGNIVSPGSQYNPQLLKLDREVCNVAH